jgi:drug/metabolite transporter (DMT)-like permease
MEIVWTRYFFALLMFPLLFPKTNLRKVWQTNHPWRQIGRALLLVGSTASIFFAVHYLPLAETYAVSFLSPFLVALLAMVFLGEKVTARRWSAIALGFAGVIIVIQPGGGVFSWAVVFPLAMAVFWAAYQVVTRLMSATEPLLTTLFFTMAVGVIALTPAMPFLWVMPDLQAWLLMLFMGLTGLVGQALLIKAYALAAASLLAPFAYSQIIWATVIGYFVFGDLPGLSTIIGVAVVIVGGFLVVSTSKDPG